MKKLLLMTVTLITLIAGSIYILIPAEIRIAELNVIGCNKDAAYRTLANSNKWETQVFLTSDPSLNIARANDYKIEIGKKYSEGLELLIKDDSAVYYSLMHLLPIGLDSTRLEWRTTLPATQNPINRARQYFKAREIKQNMKSVTGYIKKFLENRENVYGMKITFEKVRDTLLVSRRIFSSSYPNAELIDSIINGLKSFINSTGAKQAGYPMLHVAGISNSTGYEFMVAVPINKVVTNLGEYVFKRMVPGNILTAEIRGGMSRIKEGEAQLENFVRDYKFISPAIPFQSLVTNRMVEKDTSKWITKLYYPIL
jgi:hypothetical protein